MLCSLLHKVKVKVKVIPQQAEGAQGVPGRLTFWSLTTYIYICRTAALTSRRYILNIYSTNIHTEYFKHAA